MKPILYYHPFSPPVRSVLLLIKALNLDIDLKLVDLIKRENRRPEYLKINPMHTVPVLKSKDLTLMDSHSILMYLADAFGSETPLFGKNDIIKRANIVNKLMFNATFFFRRDSELFADVFIHQKKDFKDHNAKIQEAYQCLEIFLSESNGQFTAGDQMTIADFSIVATLSTCKLMIDFDEKKFPNITRWFNLMKSLPYYGEANQQGLDEFKEFLNKFVDLK